MKVYFVIPSDKGREFVREQEFFETLTGKFNVVPKGGKSIGFVSTKDEAIELMKSTNIDEFTLFQTKPIYSIWE